MANAFLTITMVSYEQLRVLYNEIRFAKRINRQYDSMFAVAGAKVGATVNARKPPRYTVRTGQAVQIQNMVETQVPITLTNQDGIDLQASTADFALSIDDFSNRFLRPAAIAIANQIDFNGTSTLTPLVSNVVGTPGTAPTALSTYNAGKSILDYLACPRSDRQAILSPGMEEAAVNAAVAYFNPTSQISEQYRQGEVTRYSGFEWDMDVNVFTQTTGTIAATSFNTTSNTATSVVTGGWTAADVVKRGDIVSFVGALAVNPQNRQSTGSLLGQVATADATADGSGNMTINVSPGFVTSGQFQNVVANPTAGSGNGRFYGSANPSTYSAKSSPQGLLFHPDFGTLACADLPVYEKGVVEGYRVPAPELGLSVRVLKAYNIMTDQLVTRSDILYGWAGLYPNELAVRVAA